MPVQGEELTYEQAEAAAADPEVKPLTPAAAVAVSGGRKRRGKKSRKSRKGKKPRKGRKSRKNKRTKRR